MLIVMDHLSQPSLKSLKMHFHTIAKWMDATGEEKCDVMPGKRSAVMRTVHFFVVIGLKHAQTLAQSIKWKHNE